MELPEEITARRSIGHSHVMAPELRDPIKTKDVAWRLTLKPASRLRRMQYYAGAMSFSARLENESGGTRRLLYFKFSVTAVRKQKAIRRCYRSIVVDQKGRQASFHTSVERAFVGNSISNASMTASLSERIVSHAFLPTEFCCMVAIDMHQSRSIAANSRV